MPEEPRGAFSPESLVAGLRERLAPLAAPLAPVQAAPNLAARPHPQPHFGFSLSAPLAQATGTEVPVPPTGTAQPAATATGVPSATTTPGSPPRPTGTPGAQRFPIYPSRGELVPGRATSLAPPGEYRLQATRAGGGPRTVLDQCAPNVQVSAQVNGQQALQVTLAAAGAGNLLQRVYFPRQSAQNPGDRFTNAFVSFTDQAVAAEILDVTYILTPPVAALTLFVTAVVPGQPVHVPLVVTDSCGDWPTFVGGGPNAGLARYVHGPGGLVYATTLDGTSILYVYHLDGQGSVRALTSGTLAPSTVLFSTSYDPWGLPLFQEGALGTGQPFGYTGAVFDPDFQFHYLRARWYNPKSGRFLERDRAPGALATPGALHRYAYAQHNPLAYHDPTGARPLVERSGLRHRAPLGLRALLPWLPLRPRPPQPPGLDPRRRLHPVARRWDRRHREGRVTARSRVSTGLRPAVVRHRPPPAGGGIT